jgi:hypothetical protein
MRAVISLTSHAQVPQPKRRRASAQPRPSAVPPPIPIPLPAPPTPIVEVDEPEESPARKIIRQGRLSSFAEDSGWEDNNVFQSGAEDSSPVRAPASKSRPTRKSTATSRAPRKSRTASSAPPEMQPAAERLARSRSPVKLPESTFEPKLPLAFPRGAATASTRAGSAAPTSPARSPHPVFAAPSVVLEQEEPISQSSSQVPVAEDVFGPISASNSLAQVDAEDEEAGPVDDDDQYNEMEEEHNGSGGELDSDAAHVRAVSKTIADGGKSLVRRTPRAASRPWYLTLLYSLAACFVLSFGYEYKRDSADIGFCDTGKTTNDLIQQRKEEMNAIEECNRLNRTLLYAPEALQSAEDLVPSRECPPPMIVPQLHPMTCTPCPAHASCSRFTVACDNGYLLRPHVLLSFLPPPPPTSPSSDTFKPTSTFSEFMWTGISKTFDGLPYMGPIAFPPRCVVDLKRTHRINALGQVVDKLLAQERGRRLCSGEFENVKIPDSEGGEASKWGFEIEALKRKLNKGNSVRVLLLARG